MLNNGDIPFTYGTFTMFYKFFYKDKKKYLFIYFSARLTTNFRFLGATLDVL